jgi:ribonuclease J
VRRLPPEEVVLLTTGSQGEPTSALVRIANQDHREVQVTPGDTVIISATPIPGNELLVSRTIDNLLRQGAKVLYDRIALVHVHGHASQEELKMMLSLTRPQYFVPVHGEYRHLMAHARLAWDLNVAGYGIFVLEDGDVLELSETGGQVVETVSAGPMYIDGLITHDTRSQVLRDRRALARDGVVAAIISINRETNQPERPPQIVASGFMAPSETAAMFQELSSQLEQFLAEEPDLPDDLEQMKSKVREIVRKFLFNTTHRRPMIIPVVLEI